MGSVGLGAAGQCCSPSGTVTPIRTTTTTSTALPAIDVGSGPRRHRHHAVAARSAG
jgi:hypothetical protein